MAAVHSIKWKLALNMLRAAAESKSVSLGRQWNEKGQGQAETLPKGHEILVDSSAATLPEAFPFV